MIVIISGKECIIDDSDLQIINGKRWIVTSCNGKQYVRFNYSDTIDGKRKQIHLYLHRHLLSAPKGMEVDHINGNTLDNRRSNLRVCTHRENIRNKKTPSHNKSGYKGVSYSARYKKYMVCIKMNGKTLHLGGFADPKEGYEVYKAKALELFGEYANFGSVSPP